MAFSIKRHKLTGLMAGLLLLPIVAACNETPQATVPDSSVTESPVSESPVTTSPNATAPNSTTATNAEDIVSVVETNPSLSTLASALEAADLKSTLEGTTPYTVFAPTDAAFEAIPAETRQQLLLPENQETLRQLLLYHVVPGQVTAQQLQAGAVETAAGESVDVQVDSATQQVRVNTANVTQPDILAENGVVHVIDQVILPPNFAL
ncbi:MAG: fasciclin domain-containing protein [Elainella sp. Prado103]|jgi:uncharacterized surface protein with fasciclin (FAS1) repeats|nr:fasciclin domain-containing protein [Elainella sp. Prado103]